MFFKYLLAIWFLFCFIAGANASMIPGSDIYGVIVGVLIWEDETIGVFPQKNRKDKEFYDTLQSLGVSSKNLFLLLDKEATLNNINFHLDKAIKHSNENSVFIFYYAGHGIIRDDVLFCNYDIKPYNYKEINGFKSGYLFKALRKFKGKKVILLADCCYSGILAEIAEKLSNVGVNAMSVTSAACQNASTRNWTYTQSLIDAFRGDPSIDLNSDGKISWSDLSGCIAKRMKLLEFQICGHYKKCPDWYLSLSSKYKFSIVNRLISAAIFNDLRKLSVDYCVSPLEKKFKIGQYVLGNFKTRQKPVKIVAYHGDRYLVEFYNYSEREFYLAEEHELKRIVFQRYNVGQKIKVLYRDKKLYDAQVVKTYDDFHLIRYSGFSSVYDEWVLSNRILDPEFEKKPNIEVSWNGEYYPARIMRQMGNEYYINYLDYDYLFNEWISKDRLKP